MQRRAELFAGCRLPPPATPRLRSGPFSRKRAWSGREQGNLLKIRSIERVVTERRVQKNNISTIRRTFLISYSIVCEFSLNTVSLILNLYFLSSTLSLTYCFESSLKITLQALYNTYFLLLSFSKRWTILLSTKYDRVNTINPLSTFS